MDQRRRRIDRILSAIPIHLDVVESGLYRFFRRDVVTTRPSPPRDPLSVMGFRAVRLEKIRRTQDVLEGQLRVYSSAGTRVHQVEFHAGRPATDSAVVLDGVSARVTLHNRAWRLDQDRLIGAQLAVLLADDLADNLGLSVDPSDPAAHYRLTADGYELTRPGVPLAVKAAMFHLVQIDGLLHPATTADLYPLEFAAMRELQLRDPDKRAAAIRVVPHLASAIRRATPIRIPEPWRTRGDSYSGWPVMLPKMVAGTKYLGAAAVGEATASGRNLGQGLRYLVASPIEFSNGLIYQVASRNELAADENAILASPRLIQARGHRGFVVSRAALAIAGGASRALTAQIGIADTNPETVTFARTFGAETGLAHATRDMYSAFALATSLRDMTRNRDLNGRILKVLQRGEPADQLDALEFELQRLMLACVQLLPEAVADVRPETQRSIEILRSRLDEILKLRSQFRDLLETAGIQPAATSVTQHNLTVRQIVTSRMVPDWAALAPLLPVLWATGHLELLTIFLARVVTDSMVSMRIRPLTTSTQPAKAERAQQHLAEDRVYTDTLVAAAKAVVERAVAAIPPDPSKAGWTSAMPYAKNAGFELLGSELATLLTLLSEETQGFAPGMAALYALRAVQDALDRWMVDNITFRHHDWQHNRQRHLAAGLLVRELRMRVQGKAPEQQPALLAAELAAEADRFHTAFVDFAYTVADDVVISFDEACEVVDGDPLLAAIWDAVRPADVNDSTLWQPARVMEQLLRKAHEDPVAIREHLHRVLDRLHQHKVNGADYDLDDLRESLEVATADAGGAGASEATPDFDDIATMWSAALQEFTRRIAEDIALGEVALAHMREFMPPELLHWRRLSVGDGSVLDSEARELAQLLVRLYDMDGVGRAGANVLTVWSEKLSHGPQGYDRVPDGCLSEPHQYVMKTLGKLTDMVEQDVKRVDDGYRLLASPAGNSVALAKGIDPSSPRKAAAAAKRRRSEFAKLAGPDDDDWRLGAQDQGGATRFHRQVATHVPHVRRWYMAGGRDGPCPR